MTRRIHIYIISLVVAMISLPAAAGPVSLKVSLDSAYLLMGKTTPMHIELVTDDNSGGQLIIPSDSMCDKVEILRALDADTVDIGSHRREIRRQLILQSFDSGTYRLNPLRYVENGETIMSNRLVLKVQPAIIDSMQNIHDYADVTDVDRKFADYLPDFLVEWWMWILAVIIVLAGAWYLLARTLRRKDGPAAPKEKPIPPYERAVMDLNTLRADKLCEQGREKEYYTRLTDILRVYLQGRFGINAMEMTSTQIRRTLRTNEQTRMSRPLMDQVLEIADFVKYAKMRPLPDDNVRAFNAAMQFVEDTRPVPRPEPEGDDNTEPDTGIKPQDPTHLS